MQRLIAKLAFCLVCTVALAQTSQDPFFSDVERLRHAYRTTVMEARLEAIPLIASGGGLPAELGEQHERLLEDDLPRLAGSLARADADLLARLRESLKQVGRAVEAGDLELLGERSAEAARLTEAARELLVGRPESLDSVFVAAVTARLLLGEPGVAEGYEEAVEGERWEYTLGWVILQRVDALWRQLAGERGSDDVDEAIGQLHALFPGPVPADSLVADPEEAEEPSQRIVGLLETLLDARLYPDRDLARLAVLTTDLADDACVAHGQGSEEYARELLLAAADSYEYLAGTASFLAPEHHERVERAFAALALVGDSYEDGESSQGSKDDEGDSGGESGAGSESGEGAEGETRLRSGDVESTCEDLREALEGVSSALGG